MGTRHDYAINGLIFAFLVQAQVCLWLVEKFRQNWRWFIFFVVTTRFSCKQKCTITTKQHYCRFLVLNRNIQHVRAGVALFTVVETGSFLSWKVNTLSAWACWTIHISNNILNWLFRRFKKINPLTKLQEKRICLFFKGNISRLTRGRALRTLIVVSRDWKVFLCTQSRSEHIVLGYHTFPMGLIMLL